MMSRPCASSLWSAPISRGVIPLALDLNFERERDKAWPFRINMQDQYFLCPEIDGMPKFVLPLAYGFRTDGPSIPWYAQWVVPKDGSIWPNAIPHDEGCAAELFRVDTCNKIFGAAMDNSPTPIPRYQQVLAQAAVDKLCWLTWRKHRRDDVEEDRALILDASRQLWHRYEPMFEGYARIEEISPAYGMAA